MEIQLHGLTKVFAGKTAVDRVSLVIGDRSLVALLGPSGCGKTTMLNMIAGLIAPTEGEILFDGRRVDGVPTQRRNIGMVFQDYALYPHMTAAENMGFPLKVARTPKEEIRRRVGEMAAFLRLDSLLGKRPAQLSGGEQQRVAIGRALMKKPGVLLMDEPLSNLDKALRVHMREEIRRIQQSLGMTTVFVTHDQEEAAAISDHIVLMRQGKVMSQGSPAALYSDPENLFTASFIGPVAMNLRPGTVRDGVFVPDGGRCLHPAPLPDGRHTFGVRPEGMMICRDPQGEDVVELAEHSGREWILTVRSDGALWKAYAPSSETFTPGERVRLSVRPDAGIWFDEEGNRRRVAR